MTDRAMIEHACKRGEVVVVHGNRQRLATLIAWRPHRPNGTRRPVARVEFRPGVQATVPVECVAMVS